jgi:hypothetical protein
MWTHFGVTPLPRHHCHRIARQHPPLLLYVYECVRYVCVTFSRTISGCMGYICVCASFLVTKPKMQGACKLLVRQACTCQGIYVCVCMYIRVICFVYVNVCADLHVSARVKIPHTKGACLQMLHACRYIHIHVKKNFS